MNVIPTQAQPFKMEERWRRWAVISCGPMCLFECATERTEKKRKDESKWVCVSSLLDQARSTAEVLHFFLKTLLFWHPFQPNKPHCFPGTRLSELNSQPWLQWPRHPVGLKTPMITQGSNVQLESRLWNWLSSILKQTPLHKLEV